MKREKHHRPLGLVMWEGPSRIDVAPIVVILTGLRHTTRNSKTGPMLQTWILRSDMPPLEARATGQAKSVCGACSLLNTLCYVRVEQAPTEVYKTWKAGKYPHYVPTAHDALIAPHAVRFGAYGDPTAAPYDVWEQLWIICAGHTGYTHQWADPRFARFANLLMASCESPAAARAAQAAGWRTFRLGMADAAIKNLDILCPSDRVQCKDCGLCRGGQRKARSIYIQGHGGNSVMRKMREFFKKQSDT